MTNPKTDGEERRLLFYIEDNPNLTAKELQDQLGWKRSRLNFYLRQLAKSGEVKMTYFAIPWRQMIKKSEVDD